MPQLPSQEDKGMSNKASPCFRIQCKRSNLTCDGYDRDLIFVSHNSEANSPPPTVTKSQKSASGVKKPTKAAASPSTSSSCSSRHSSSPDPPAFTTIEFYHTPVPPPVCPPVAASPCKLLSSLDLFDLGHIRTQFKPLDTAINAVNAATMATSSCPQPDACFAPQPSALYSQALFELRKQRQKKTLRHDSWHSTAFTSLMLQLVEIMDATSIPLSDWYSHSAEITSLPPMSSIQQFGASDISTLNFCRTAMMARDLLSSGCEPSDHGAWHMQSWGDAVNDDLHRVLDVIALLPSHLQMSDRIAVNPYDETLKYDFEQQAKHLSAIVQGLYNNQIARGDFAHWVIRPFETTNSCTDSHTPCMSISACQRLVYIWLTQMLVFTAGERVRCSMSFTPDSMNQGLEGDIEWLMMLETMSNMQHVIAHCTAVDNDLVGMHMLITPLRVIKEFATSYQLTEAQDWCCQTVQGFVDRNCQIAQIAPWSILNTQSFAGI